MEEQGSSRGATGEVARQQQDLVAKVIKQAHKLAEAGPITASPHKSIGSVLSVTDLKPSRRLTEN